MNELMNEFMETMNNKSAFDMYYISKDINELQNKIDKLSAKREQIIQNYLFSKSK